VGVLSFNGNKTITTGGGGIIITNNKSIALKAKHITTTAKLPHKWEYIFKETGYNFRMPNINAALGLAQLKNLKRSYQKKEKFLGFMKTIFQKLKELD
jgi:perosamine synthetase